MRVRITSPRTALPVVHPARRFQPCCEDGPDDRSHSSEYMVGCSAPLEGHAAASSATARTGSPPPSPASLHGPPVHAAACDCGDRTTPSRNEKRASGCNASVRVSSASGAAALRMSWDCAATSAACEMPKRSFSSASKRRLSPASSPGLPSVAGPPPGAATAKVVKLRLAMPQLHSRSGEPPSAAASWSVYNPSPSSTTSRTSSWLLWGTSTAR
mmetsp:Transcript_14180/g.42796  ORF Transcript_14180/g.42796 Transcript_14180/m.42796 type:complete len:214 (+) Transcript_14180:3461-4102(+)